MASAVSGAAASFGGMTGEGFALVALAGACAILGASYFRSTDDEPAGRDAVVTLVAPFVGGGALGGEVGSTIFFWLAGEKAIYSTPFSHHVVGGLIVGALMTPVARAVFGGGIDAITRILQSLANRGGK